MAGHCSYAMTNLQVGQRLCNRASLPRRSHKTAMGHSACSNILEYQGLCWFRQQLCSLC